MSHFVCFVAVRVQEHNMPPPVRCNKCKVGKCQVGDSWCIGCSSLELGQSLLRQPWSHPGIRAAAEESILGAARLVKAFSNLDRGLGHGTAESVQGVTPKSKARDKRSRSPRRENRPPLPRPPSPPPRPASARGHSPRGSERREPSREASEELSEEESEEEAAVGESPQRHPESDRRVKTEQAAGEPSPGSRPPPEPKSPPRRREDRPEIPRRRESDRDQKEKRRRRKKKKQKKRGGRKHQKHWRELADPFRRSHRPLGSSILGLATSFRSGLGRRI